MILFSKGGAMAKTYQLGRFTRLINWVFGGMTRLGVGASYREVLTVRGRKSGQLRSTPVGADMLEVGSRGLGGFRGLLLGSVIQQCAQHAQCPVVIVPAEERS
jgi:nucleotide-binding universal stress UspA family protein